MVGCQNPLFGPAKNIPTEHNVSQINSEKSTRSSPVKAPTLGVLVVNSSTNNSSTLKMQEVDLSSTQSPTTRLDSIHISMSDANTVKETDMRIVGKNWGEVSDDEIVSSSTAASESVATSNPVVEADMNILRKLWGQASDDVGDPVASNSHRSVAQNDYFEPVVSKTQKKKLKQKKNLIVDYNTRSKAISESF